jgi:ADP-L-glycero-D-manno-heptose 6-epimerase
MIVITGGAGFIGSNIAIMLSEAGKKVVVCDYFGTDDKWRNTAHHLFTDMIAPSDLFYWLGSNTEDITAIVHMGAISSTVETDSDLLLENNYTLSKVLWQWCTQNEKALIYASSASTYGNGEFGFEDDIALDYLKRLTPLNAYGWSKHSFDKYVAQQVKNEEETPPQWVGLKFFNVYGPNEVHKEAQKSVVAQLYPSAALGQPARLFKSNNPDYADGEQIRDFIYVKDCADVVNWLLDNAQVSGLFNLGTGEGRSFNDLAAALYSALEQKTQVKYIDMPESVAPKYQYLTKANMQRLQDAGYAKPFTSIEEGVKDYVQNYLATNDGYR